MTAQPLPGPSIVTLRHLTQRYGKTYALNDLSLSFPAQKIVGLIGPDGVGKSTLLSIIAGARTLQSGTAEVLNGDISNKKHRESICPRIAYMPQGLGKNLYPTLSVEENLQFFARLFGHGANERRQRIDDLTRSTGLYPFLARPAGKLSGGMKQKLGLCCALIHDPELLLLDEPTTGVDPLARSQFWELISRIRIHHNDMSVIVATAYMDEAQQFDWLVAMDAGKILQTGTPKALLEQADTDSLEEAFISLLPEEKRHGYQQLIVPPLQTENNDDIAIEAELLTKSFGKFTAVDQVSFRIRRGEIFGFLGSNGCGKSTTIKMLTGLLPPTSGTASLFGKAISANDLETRKHVGYMSQSFSLYSELTVEQNLVLHARLFHVPEQEIFARVQESMNRFGLSANAQSLPVHLPLGVRQRLSLAVAMIHKPALLILDEPTSGVDPVARDTFWKHMIDLSRNDKVTIFITTHFMNEAQRCDRISLMHAGVVLTSDTPAAIIEKRAATTLEEAFIGYLLEAGAGADIPKQTNPPDPSPLTVKVTQHPLQKTFSIQRLYSYMWREALELQRDPVRATLALAGSLILMLVMGYGISLDVEHLRFAVLDHDQSGLSQNYTLHIAGSRYFMEQPALNNYTELDARMRAGDIAVAIEIPPQFGKQLQRGKHVEISAWIDGAMPQRAETIRSYLQAMHQFWLTDVLAQRLGVPPTQLANIETRFRYNPDVKSLPAMVPGVISLLLMMLPAMLTALSVVREKELGSIINLYVTPVTRTEFLLGKQIPYLLLALTNFFLMLILAVFVFHVPIKGSLPTLALATFLYCISSTGFGLLASSFTKSQIAAMFFTLIGTMLPAIQFSGIITPTASLEGLGKIIGEIYPTTHMLLISRGVFNKGLHFFDLSHALLMLLIAIPVVLCSTVALLQKQEV